MSLAKTLPCIPRDSGRRSYELILSPSQPPPMAT